MAGNLIEASREQEDIAERLSAEYGVVEMFMSRNRKGDVLFVRGGDDCYAFDENGDPVAIDGPLPVALTA